jgi:hypothetical protein
MREMYCGYGGLRILYSEIGDCERKKRKLQRVLLWVVSLQLLDNNKGRT